MPNNSGREAENLRDSWSAYRNQVLDTMNRLGGEIDKTQSEARDNLRDAKQDLEKRSKEVEDELRKFKDKVIADLATLKAKSALFGSLAGAVLGGLVALLVEVLKK